MMDAIEIHHGDCREIMRTLPACSVDAIVTDPPYGTEVERDGYGRRQNYGGVGLKIENDDSLDALAGMLDEAPRILKRDAWVALFCSPKRHAETAALLESKGFAIKGEVVWDKAIPGIGGGIRYQHETILLCSNGKAAGRDSLSSVLRHVNSRVPSGSRHPHAKPVPLMSEIVRYCSRPSDVVLDPFAGEGSTLIACMKTGRVGIGIEFDARWIPGIQRRISGAETPLFA